MDMNIDDVLAQVAEMNGVAVEEVKAEMQKAIHEAAQHLSGKIKGPFGGKEPTIEEFLSMLSKEVIKRTAN